MTNIRIVDSRGQGYKLNQADQVSCVKVLRSRGVVCGLYGCAIPRGAYYLYSRSEGRLCVPCGIGLGSLIPADEAS